MSKIVIISSRIVAYGGAQHKFKSKADRDAWIEKQKEKQKPEIKPKKTIAQEPKPEPEQVHEVDQQQPESILKNPSTSKDVMKLPSKDLVKRPTDPVIRPNDPMELPPKDLVKRPIDPVTRRNDPIELPSKDLVKRPIDPVTRRNDLPKLPGPQQQGEWTIEEGFVEETTIRKAWKYVRVSSK